MDLLKKKLILFWFISKYYHFCNLCPYHINTKLTLIYAKIMLFKFTFTFLSPMCSFFLVFQSGAKINISDGSCPERIVTVTGSTENIQRAFGFICKKFEEVSSFQFPIFSLFCMYYWGWERKLAFLKINKKF